jgi:ParB family protein of integrating conjugative element (PFGI_1 class)
MSAQDRLPASVTVADAARKAQQRDLAQPNGTRTISPIDLRARLVKESLNVGLPLDNSHQLSIDTESQMTLPVMDILHYDKNPRKAINDQYDVIKESIRSTKQLTSPLVVTRRPGQEKYMVGKGGNTRLTALQELFSETGDAAFQYVVVTYTPWVSESSTLSAHLVENELRGEMIFWDKARAYADLKQMIESETGNALSARAFEQTLKERGLPLGKTTLSYFNFAVTHLAALGEACKSLSRPVISELQPAFNAFERLLKHKQQIQAWPELRDQVLKRAEHSWLSTRALEPGRVIEQLEHAVATKLGETVELTRLARQLCQQHPGEDIAGLMAQARLQTEPAGTPPLPPPNAAETSAGKKGNATERTENPGPVIPEQKPKTELIERDPGPGDPVRSSDRIRRLPTPHQGLAHRLLHGSTGKRRAHRLDRKRRGSLLRLVDAGHALRAARWRLVRIDAGRLHLAPGPTAGAWPRRVRSSALHGHDPGHAHRPPVAGQTPGLGIALGAGLAGTGLDTAHTTRDRT